MALAICSRFAFPNPWRPSLLHVFSSLSKWTLLHSAIFHDVPVYVQFYITARCNLTCEQCNIIYANSDCRECSLDEIERIADNFAAMGVAIVLLTGGEPLYARICLRSFAPLRAAAFTFACRPMGMPAKRKFVR